MNDSLVFRIIWDHHIHPRYIENEQRIQIKKRHNQIKTVQTVLQDIIGDDYFIEHHISGMMEILLCISDAMLRSYGFSTQYFWRSHQCNEEIAKSQMLQALDLSFEPNILKMTDQSNPLAGFRV